MLFDMHIVITIVIIIENVCCLQDLIVLEAIISLRCLPCNTSGNSIYHVSAVISPAMFASGVQYQDTAIKRLLLLFLNQEEVCLAL